jgi:hypothetical protein
MRRLAYILLVGFMAGTLLYLLSVLGTVLNGVMPLYIWGAMVALGIIVASLVDIFGPSPE